MSTRDKESKERNIGASGLRRSGPALSILLRLRNAVAWVTAVAMILTVANRLYAHSVAQVQTTKFFTPETVQLLIDRANAGTPGFQVGDEISYIIQFTPVENNAAGGPGTIGVNGYITDYVPSGAEVTGAWIVAKSGSSYYEIPPSLPGGIDTGWSERFGLIGDQFWGAPFDTPSYDPTGRCAATGPTTQAFTANGNWTAPTGVTSVTVEAWGGGGAGGGVTTNAGAGVSYKGGGGAGGQYAVRTLTVIPGNVYAVAVGAGGTGSTGNGTVGAISTFSTNSVVASGGAGGLSYENSGTAGTGSTAGGVGDTVYAGGNGSNGGASATGGSGGGGAGSGGSGGNASGNTAGTGTATGGGNGRAGRTTTGNGQGGATNGGGGSGGYAINSNTDRTGGAGARGQVSITYDAPLYTNNCLGRLTEHYADTGIFFSTDPRTAQFPASPARISQGTNGYNVLATSGDALNGAGQLNPIIGQTQATTHNLWDADQTNAFGSATVDITPLASPKSSVASVANANLFAGYGVLGTVPYYAGSAVAGPQTGYPLDNTAQIGPWQRIAYSGSRIGDPTNGPATDAGACQTCVGGMPTSIGRSLSTSNPLPAGTNAVRWAIGRLTVGELRYVKISMRLTAPVPGAGLINGSEVFGGDSSQTDNGDDNVWRYHVPSVADNNSNLFVLKSVIGYYSGSTLVPIDGSMVPVNAKLRYRIVYMNSGNANQDNVKLTDTLPCQTNANPVSNITVVSGAISATTSPALTAISAGTCPGTRQSFVFNNNVGVTLLPAAGGTIEFDVQTTAAADDILTNTATLTSTQITAPGVTSNANSNVGSYANLTINKTTSTPTLATGGTATYTITVTNMGTANATVMRIYDILPSAGGAANAATRFSFNTGSSAVVGIAPSVNPTVTGPAPTLTPYDTGGVSSNQQQLDWNFTGGQTLAPGASFTITYGATVGASVPSSATPYLNTIAATYTGGTVPRVDNANIAGVTVTAPLSLTKSVESYCTSTCSDSGNWVAIGGSGQVPANARVRYKLDYTNTSGSLISGVTLTDTLPCQTGANSVSNITIVNGPISLPTPSAPVVAAGDCSTSTRQAFSFPAASVDTLESGSIKLDVQTNGTAGDILLNTATISGSGSSLVSSEAQASVLSAPLLQIAKSVSAPSVATGGTATYTITVTNSGTANATGILLYDWLPSSQATNSLPTRFSYAAGSSAVSGITTTTPVVARPPTKSPYSTDAYANNMEEVVWNFGAATLAPGASFTVTFSASVGGSVPPLAAYYNNARVYYGTEQANSGAVAVSVGNNLATSTKGWTDLNGGDASPGDVIEYTVTLRETSGILASGVTVTDTLSSPTFTTPTVSSCPSGATCGFSGQTLTASNVSVSANGTTEIVFRATIAAATASGTIINNCATVINGGGTGAAPCATSITVNASSVAGTGNKPLYLYSGPTYTLSRTPGSGTAVSIASGASQTWTQLPALQSTVRISNTLSTSVPVNLNLSASAANYPITARLYCSAALVSSQTQTLALTTTPASYQFYLPISTTTTCGAGSAWALRVTNGGAAAVSVAPLNGSNTSNVTLPSMDVISVATVSVLNAAYPGGTEPATFPTNTTVYIRATVNDPFGSYDITGAKVTIRNPGNTAVVSSATMTQVVASDALSKTYQYAFTLGSGDPQGNWSIKVVAEEGTEGTVTDFANAVMTVYVPMPSITIVKSVSTYSDPINLTTNPKAIPGSIMQYTILVTNTGPGAADTVVVNDTIPANTEFFAGDINGASPGASPILFADGATASGLSYTFNGLSDDSDSPSFSNTGGAYHPDGSGSGFDSAVTAFSVALGGSMNGASGGNNPSFSLIFRVRVK